MICKDFAFFRGQSLELKDYAFLELKIYLNFWTQTIAFNAQNKNKKELDQEKPNLISSYTMSSTLLWFADSPRLYKLEQW
jgi:hypothetical protein